MPHPCSIVIFGASGDLTHRLLVPAIYDLTYERLLPPGFTIVGFARHEYNNESFAEYLRDGVETFSRNPLDEDVWRAFKDGIFYVPGDFQTAKDYDTLASELERIDQRRGTLGNHLFYLATPPRFYEIIVDQLGRAELNDPAQEGAWSRVIVEKPFGRDYESAAALNANIAEVFEEDCVYRIDHYLGKETVRNILAFRFGNGIYEPLWNRNFIDQVQITVSESIGIGERATYYEHAGATRDMVQNHLMQLLSLTAMEAPASLSADAVRSEKVKVLRSVRPIEPDKIDCDAVRAQYSAGYVEGEAVPGYKSEPNVAPDSTTETYVALKLFVDNWRWAGVPFYLRTGKRMARRVTEIAIRFKPVPHRLFHSQDFNSRPDPNELILEIQPDEGISLSFKVKVPGPTFDLRPVSMVFQYGSAFHVQLPEAYERLILDAMLGDRTLFIRKDEVEVAWQIVDSVLNAWEAKDVDEIPTYEAGTWGPAEADDLLERDEREWRRP